MMEEQVTEVMRVLNHLVLGTDGPAFQIVHGHHTNHELELTDGWGSGALNNDGAKKKSKSLVYVSAYKPTETEIRDVVRKILASFGTTKVDHHVVAEVVKSLVEDFKYDLIHVEESPATYTKWGHGWETRKRRKDGTAPPVVRMELRIWKPRFTEIADLVRKIMA